MLNKTLFLEERNVFSFLSTLPQFLHWDDNRQVLFHDRLSLLLCVSAAENLGLEGKRPDRWPTNCRATHRIQGLHGSIWKCTALQRHLSGAAFRQWALVWAQQGDWRGSPRAAGPPSLGGTALQATRPRVRMDGLGEGGCSSCFGNTGPRPTSGTCRALQWAGGGPGLVSLPQVTAVRSAGVWTAEWGVVCSRWSWLRGQKSEQDNEKEGKEDSHKDPLLQENLQRLPGWHVAYFPGFAQYYNCK